MILTTRYVEALEYARSAHLGQVRKGTEIPYICHPIAVSTLVMEFGGDEDQAIAALLHDVLEDCGMKHAGEIKARFGGHVLAIVLGCTDGTPEANGKKEPWEERKRRYLKHLCVADEATLLVSLCDKLHNARAILADYRADGASTFGRFAGGFDGLCWYYRSLADVFAARLGSAGPVRLLEMACRETYGVPFPHERGYFARRA